MKKIVFLAVCFLGSFPQSLWGSGWREHVHHTTDFAQLKAEARQEKQPETFLELGKAYYFGWGTQKNLKKARKYLQKAAETNLPEAELWLADLQTKEKKNPQQVRQGFAAILRLAKEDYPPAQYKAAYLYAEGLGTPADAAQNIYWLQKAATAPAAVPPAQVRLGRMYYTGYAPYVEKNTAQAFALFSAAADAEEPQAQYYTARMYLTGEGTEKNEKLGFKYMRLAARNGLGAAQKELSGLYRTGTGVKQDDYSAFKWMLDAAQGGDVAAQEQTALNYWQGYGIAKNSQEARFWALQAKTNGSKKALEILRQIQEGNE